MWVNWGRDTGQMYKRKKLLREDQAKLLKQFLWAQYKRRGKGRRADRRDNWMGASKRRQPAAAALCVFPFASCPQTGQGTIFSSPLPFPSLFSPSLPYPSLSFPFLFFSLFFYFSFPFLLLVRQSSPLITLPKCWTVSICPSCPISTLPYLALYLKAWPPRDCLMGSLDHWLLTVLRQWAAPAGRLKGGKRKEPGCLLTQLPQCRDTCLPQLETTTPTATYLPTFQ